MLPLLPSYKSLLFPSQILSLFSRDELHALHLLSLSKLALLSAFFLLTQFYCRISLAHEQVLKTLVPLFGRLLAIISCRPFAACDLLKSFLELIGILPETMPIRSMLLSILLPVSRLLSILQV